MFIVEFFKRLLQKWSCIHEWDVYHETSVFVNDTDKRPYKRVHTLICKKCSKIKQINV